MKLFFQMLKMKIKAFIGIHFYGHDERFYAYRMFRRIQGGGIHRIQSGGFFDSHDFYQLGCDLGDLKDRIIRDQHRRDVGICGNGKFKEGRGELFLHMAHEYMVRVRLDPKAPMAWPFERIDKLQGNTIALGFDFWKDQSGAVRRGCIDWIMGQIEAFCLSDPT